MKTSVNPRKSFKVPSFFRWLWRRHFQEIESLSKHDGDGSENVIWKCNFAFLQSIFRELKQPRRRRQQKPHKFAYLTMENSIFARFARAYFIFWHLKLTFSFFLRREITSFTVEWTTSAYDDKCSILSSYVPSACSSLIPGQLEHIFQA